MDNKSLRNIFIVAAVIAAAAAAFFTITYAGTGKAKPGKDVVEIKEKMFMTQVNDIYLNAEDYLGKTIKLQGIFKQEEGFNFVIRYGPGCCGNDANAGFEVAWAKGKPKQYPDTDSWVEATGVLKTYGDEFMQLLYLDLTSLTKLSKRGAETVMQ